MNNIAQILSQLTAVAAVDFTAQPQMRFCGALRSALVDTHGFPPVAAERIALRTKAKFTGTSPSDDELAALAQALAAVVEKQRQAYVAMGFSDGAMALAEIAEGYELEV